MFCCTPACNHSVHSNVADAEIDALLQIVQVFREDKPARKVTVLGEVELISWITVEDLSKDRKGGMLLKIIEEGGQGPDGYKKPKDLSKCRVHYTVAAVVTDSLPDPHPRCSLCRANRRSLR